MKTQYQLGVLLAFAGCSTGTEKIEISYNPNILWIFVEDISDNISCYGENTIQTPNIDKLASEGELFENAFVTCPVCSPSRSAIITGMYQTTIGAHNHRSQRKEGNGGGSEPYWDSYQLPEDIPFLPSLFKEKGYYTVLGDGRIISGLQNERQSLGKSDYNFEWDNTLYDANDWRSRQPGQPFFAQVQLSGGKFRRAQPDTPVNPENVSIPPYYPDDMVLRTDWAEYLNSIIHLDQQVEGIIKRLDAEGIADSTVIFFFSDHGISHLRGKQFLYEDGIKVPLIVRWPEMVKPGTRRKDLVSHIDISATSLFLAGIDIPDIMQGQSLYGDNYQPREYIFAGRDRCDETVDLIRAIRTDKYKYIRNFFPHKPHSQPNRYKYNKEIIRHMQDEYDYGNLKSVTGKYFDPTRPSEELYDLESDPFELYNLAEVKEYQYILHELRDTLMSFIHNTQDMGFIPEPLSEEMGLNYGNKIYILQQPENRKILERCISVMKLDEKGDIDGLKQALSDNSAPVRFWAAYGLGNIPELGPDVLRSLQQALNDESDAVKIAAARALCLNNRPDPGLNILTGNLEHSNHIIGFYSSLFIEDLEFELIKTVREAIEKAQDNPYEFTGRIATRMSSKF